MASHPKKSQAAMKTVTLKTGLPVDNPPEYFGTLAKVCYQKVVADLKEMGIADRADSRSIELFCAAYEEYRKARKIVLETGFTMEVDGRDGSRDVVRPEVGVAENAWTRMRSLLPELYLTPAARSKAPGNGPATKEDPFAEFMKED